MAETGGQRYIVAGDVGGTNTRLLLYTVPADTPEATQGHATPGDLVHRSKYANEDYTSFEEVVEDFLASVPPGAAPGLEERSRVAVAAFAVAGPVDEGAAVLSNRGSWAFVEADLEAALGFGRVVLANDFVAAGYGLLTLCPDDLVTLQDVEARVGAPIACIGAGTGLGECFLTADPRTTSNGHPHYTAFPSEGGHAEWAPRTELEVELLAFLKTKFAEKNRVSVERVVSGKGLFNIYEFLRGKFPNAVDDALDAKVFASDDQRGAVIAQGADQGDELCTKAIDIMLSAYGSEAGVAALKWLPYGGLYIAGGLAPKNIHRITPDSGFMAAFFDKGRLSPQLKKVPLHVVINEDIGQRGAHRLAYSFLSQ